MGLRRLLADLTGKGDRRLLDALLAQIDACVSGVTVVEQALATGVRLPEGGLTEALESVEEDGDAARTRLVEHLAAALSTPLDREDLFRLSRSIDDVLDNLRDFAREYDLYAPATDGGYAPLLEALRAGLDRLREGVVDVIGDRVEDVRSRTKAAKREGSILRRRYEQQIAALFTRELDMEVLKHRELLRRLDVAGLRLGEACDALADAALKRTA